MHSEFKISSAKAMRNLGTKLAQDCQNGTVIFFNGELGAGKTTFVRGFLAGLGFTGKVRSPTFTLVEPYTIGNITVYHFDLYRLTDPEELEFIGFRDYFNSNSICLVEWPERASKLLPKPDLLVEIKFDKKGRTVKIIKN